jgi:hypothetical protein
MTPEHDQDERLRAALARSVGAYAPSPAPVERILTAGRVRRARRRRAAVLAAATSVLVAGMVLPLSCRSDSPEPSHPLPPATSPPVHLTAPPVAGPVRAQVGRGTVDGTSWSVTLEYYPTRFLLCQRMVVGGVRIDHQGGPWTDCRPLTGAHDPHGTGEEGLWGPHDKGTTGSRLFVADPEANVASGVVTLTDGTRLKAHTVTVPHTSYRAWAVAIPDARTIATIDQYDTGHHRVSHETDWR